MLKNKNLLIIVGIVLVLLLGVGGYFVFGTNASPEEETEEQMFDEEVVTLSPEEVGLEIIPSANNKQVKFTLNKLDGFTKIEYELSYEADSAAGSDEGDGGRISRGVAGEDVIDASDTSYESKFLDLGSCSSGTCRYDKGVESVNLLLKLTKADGSVYQVEDSLTLE